MTQGRQGIGKRGPDLASFRDAAISGPVVVAIGRSSFRAGFPASPCKLATRQAAAGRRWIGAGGPTMANGEAARVSSVLTIAQAAADLQVAEARVWRFHREGRLTVMYLAGSARAGRCGSKDGRIDVAEWDRFKKSLAVGIRPDNRAEPEPPRRGRPTNAEVAARPGPGRPLTEAEKYAAKAARRSAN